MANPVQEFSKRLWQYTGKMLVPTFDNAYKPGAILRVGGSTNVDLVGHLEDGLPAESVPHPGPPEACTLVDFNKSHQIRLDAALTFIGLDASVKPAFQKVTDVLAHFDAPMTYRVSLIKLETLVESQPPAFWQSSLGQYLVEKNVRVVYEVIRGRFSLLFRQAGGIGVDLTGARGALNASLGAKWSWRNEATIEAKKEHVIAVDYARYDKKLGRFRTAADG
jgi:hypothetical protein